MDYDCDLIGLYHFYTHALWLLVDSVTNLLLTCQSLQVIDTPQPKSKFFGCLRSKKSKKLRMSGASKVTNVDKITSCKSMYPSLISVVFRRIQRKSSHELCLPEKKFYVVFHANVELVHCLVMIDRILKTEHLCTSVYHSAFLCKQH